MSTDAEAERAWIHHTEKGLMTGPLRGARKRHFAPRQANVLFVLTLTDFRSRYRGQALGLTWSLLYPMAMMGVLAAVFRNVARFDVPHYPVFVLIGIIYWQFCTRSLTQATQIFVAHSDVAKKATFPRYLLPISKVFSFAIAFMIELLLVFLLAAFSPGSLQVGWEWLLLPVVFVLLLALLVGVSLVTSTLYAFFRDIAFLVDTALLFLYWGTPILYPPEALTGRLRTIVDLNPFGAVVVSLRSILMTGALPPINTLIVTVAGPLLALGFGLLVYRQHATRLPDQL